MNLWQWLWFCPLGVAAVRLYPDRRTCTVFPSKKLHYLCQVSNHLLTGLASACSSIYHGPWCFLSVRLELHTFPGWSYSLKDDTGFAIGKIMFIQVSVFLLKQCYTSTGRKIQVRGEINRYTHICAGASKSDCQRLLITPRVTSCQELEISHGGSIYTTEMGKRYASEISLLPERCLLTIYQHTAGMEFP